MKSKRKNRNKRPTYSVDKLIANFDKFKPKSDLYERIEKRDLNDSRNTGVDFADAYTQGLISEVEYDYCFIKMVRDVN